MTHSIYREGTIGKAKDDLEATVVKINENLKGIGGKAYVSLNKAVVTQASAAIPVISLYISALFKVMKEKISMRAVSNKCTECSVIGFIQGI